MKNLKIEDLKKEIIFRNGITEDNIRDITNYTGYICDAITEIADNNVDIYAYDLFDWAKDNYSYIEEANEEFGTPTDILQQIRQGQFFSYEQQLQEDIEEIMLYCMYQILLDRNIQEITEKQNDGLITYNLYNIEKFEELNNIIDEILEEEEEKEEE